MVRKLILPVSFALFAIMVAEGTSGDKKKEAIKGTVVAVEMSKDSKDSGTIIVKTPEKKKKDVVVSEAKEHKIAITKDTKFEKAAAKAKDPGTPAVFADVAKDQMVAVTHDAGKAEKVVILPAKK